MEAAFIFGGALTALQEKCVRESKGSLVSFGDDLSSFDAIVIGVGVRIPDIDNEAASKIVGFDKFLSSMKDDKDEKPKKPKRGKVDA